MSLSLHSLAIETFVPTLRTLSKLLDMGAAHAAEKMFDPTALVQARLAPDILPLAAQVRLACHHARDATSLETLHMKVPLGAGHGDHDLAILRPLERGHRRAPHELDRLLDATTFISSIAASLPPYVVPPFPARRATARLGRCRTSIFTT
ncbi:MAG: DUF1993 family protein [Polyangiaceae bacterium]